MSTNSLRPSRKAMRHRGPVPRYPALAGNAGGSRSASGSSKRFATPRTTPQVTPDHRSHEARQWVVYSDNYSGHSQAPEAALPAAAAHMRPRIHDSGKGPGKFSGDHQEIVRTTEASSMPGRIWQIAWSQEHVLEMWTMTTVAVDPRWVLIDFVVE
jgi:hypothetical protein